MGPPGSSVLPLAVTTDVPVTVVGNPLAVVTALAAAAAAALVIRAYVLAAAAATAA